MSTAVKDALSVIITRLSAISTGSGYNTDAGSQVYAGVRYFQDDSTFPLITVFSGDEIPEKLTYNRYRAERAVNVECYVQDASTPTVSIEELIEDVQKAIELPDTTLGGAVEVIDYAGISEVEPSEAGSDITAARINYVLTYSRDYGA